MASSQSDEHEKCSKRPNCMEQYLRFGRYQLFCTLMYTLASITCVNTMSYMSFAGSKPTVTCHNESDPSMSVSTNVVQEACALQQSCATNLSMSADFTSIIEHFGLLCDMSSVYSLTTMQMVGVMIGAVCSGQLSDLFGRKKVLLACWTGAVLVEAVCSFSTSLTMFLACRTLAGFLVAGVISAGYVIFVEVLDVNRRFMMTSLSGWSPAYCVYGLIGYLCQGWSQLSLYPSLAMLPVIVLALCLMEESPRWLLQKGRLHDAQKVLLRITRWNKMHVDIDVMEEQLQEDLALMLTQRSSNKKYSFWHLCYSWTLTRYSVCMAVIWLVTSCVSYGMLFNIGNLAGNVYINMTLYGMCRFAAQTLFAVLGMSVKGVGRKAVLLGAVTVMITCGTSIILLQLLVPASWLYLHSCLRLFNIIMAAFTSPCWILVTLLSAELYPTPIRTIAHGSFSMFARIGGAIAPQLLSLNDLYWPFSAHLAFVLLLVIEVLCVTLGLDETKNRPMPEHMPDVQYRIGFKHNMDKDTDTKQLKYAH